MATSNVYSSAKVINAEDGVQEYKLESFKKTSSSHKHSENQNVSFENSSSSENTDDALLGEIQNLSAQLQQINQRISNIENEGVKSKDIDAQVVQAIKDLKHYASFFEQAIFQLESKLLKTSISIAQKIIGIEVGENSSKIAKQTVVHLLDKIKTASKVQIHLNPKDYELLKNELTLEPFIQLRQDQNVSAGGVVISSDLGNFDGNINSKIASMLETLDNVI